MRKNKINILITKLADKTDNSNEFEVPQPQKKQKIETENFLGQKKMVEIILENFERYKFECYY